jgi:hypothetical protein
MEQRWLVPWLFCQGPRILSGHVWIVWCGILTSKISANIVFAQTANLHSSQLTIIFHDLRYVFTL